MYLCAPQHARVTGCGVHVSVILRYRSPPRCSTAPHTVRSHRSSSGFSRICSLPDNRRRLAASLMLTRVRLRLGRRCLRLRLAQREPLPVARISCERSFRRAVWNVGRGETIRPNGEILSPTRMRTDQPHQSDPASASWDQRSGTPSPR